MFRFVLALTLLPILSFAATDRKLDAGILEYKHLGSSPATPSAGYSRCYFKTDGFYYCLSTANVEKRLLDIVSFGTSGQLFNTTGSAIGLTTSTFPSTNNAGDLLYGSGSNAWGALGIGTANYLLGSNSGGTAPEYKAVTVTAAGALTAPLALRSNTSLILEDPNAGTDTITIQATTPSGGSYSVTLPAAQCANGETWVNNGSGILSCGSAGSGATPSAVTVYEGGGLGSVGTCIRYFVNSGQSQGTDITYTSSTTNGDSFTVNTTGVYDVAYCDVGNAQRNTGISVNASSLSTALSSLSYANGRRQWVTSAGNGAQMCVSLTQYLTAGDVVRAHTVDCGGFLNDPNVIFSISGPK